MRKAKLMLTAIAVLAIVGGTLASKARIDKVLYTGPAGGGVCTITTISAGFSAVGLKVAASTEPKNSGCLDRTTTIVPNID